MAIGAVLMVSGQVLLIRMGMQYSGTLSVFNTVLIVNVAVFVPISLVWHYPNYELTPFALFAFGMSGLLGIFLGRMCYFHSVGLIGASRSEPIKASSPLVSVVLALLILGETMTLLEGAGMLLIAGGAVLTSWEMASDGRDQTSDFSLVSLVFPLAAAFFYGAEPIFVKWGFSEGTPLLVGLVVKILVGATFFWGYLVGTGQFVEQLNIFQRDRRWFLGAGVVNTMFLFFYFGALEVAPVVVVLPIIQTSPIIVALLSLVFLPKLERVTAPLLVACLAVVVGAILLQV